MAQLFGAYGSQLRQDYTQPPTKPGETQFIAKGKFLQPGDGVASLDYVDPSRYRPGTYVLPTQIELLDGYFDKGLSFWNSDPTMNALVMPRDVFISQTKQNVPVGYEFQMMVSPDPRTSAQAQLAAEARAGGGQPYATNPYGLVVNAAISPENCPGYITVGGACQIPRNNAAYLPNSAVGNTWQ
jgi:hypothetical protein